MWPRWITVLRFAAAFVLVSLSTVTAPSSASAQSDTGDGPVYVMRISGTIDLALAPYVKRVIEAAENHDASAILIEIDTPGGRLDAVLQMRDAILDSNVRTIALVSTAYSAGALVAIASDEIYMTPGAVLGAATPVSASGEIADEKTISAVRAAFESAAEANGRDPVVAAAMVDSRIAIDGLVSDQELLTLTVSKAVEFGYADGVVQDRTALLAELGLDGNELTVVGLGVAEQLVRFLTHPLVAGLLLLGGFLLVIGDFFSGGVGVAALAGVALLALFFWGHLIAGLAGWEDLALIVVGIALLAAEVFVIPGFGVAGIAGLIAIGAGAFLAMLSRDFDIVTGDDLWRAGITVAVTLVGAATGIVLLIMAMSRRGAPGGLVLTNGRGGASPVSARSARSRLRWFGADDRLEPDRVERHTSDLEPSLDGAVGVAMSDLRPSGIVEVGGRRIDAVTSGEFVAAGEPIEVVRDERYRRVVRKRA